MKQNKEHLANFTIAGFTYYDGVDCFDELSIGKEVKLVMDTQNKYDPRAVAVYYKDFKLGYIPRQENRIFYKLLTMGYQDIIVCKIQKKDATANPEAQIQLVSHLIAKTD